MEFPMCRAVPRLSVQQGKSANKHIKLLTDDDGDKGDEDVDNYDDEFYMLDITAHGMKVENKEKKTPKSIFEARPTKLSWNEKGSFHFDEVGFNEVILKPSTSTSKNVSNVKASKKKKSVTIKATKVIYLLDHLAR